MSKKVVRVMKIQFKAGQAKPGPALAGAGIQMPKFCTAFNDQTKDRMGETVPVVLTVYEDKDFSFVLKTAPASEMIKKALGVQKGSSNAGTTTVGTLSADKLKEIAEYKMPDLNAYDLDAAMKIVAGTAKNMGVKVEGIVDFAQSAIKVRVSVKTEAGKNYEIERRMRKDIKNALDEKGIAMPYNTQTVYLKQ